MVSADVLNDAAPIVWGLRVDVEDPGLDYPLAIKLDGDLPQPLWVHTALIRTIARHALTDLLGTVDDDTMEKVTQTLSRITGLEHRG